MGLDMYAYVAARAGQQSDYYEGSEFDEETREYVNKKVTKPREISYWRKHPNLHGWMEKLWLRKNGYPSNTDDQFIEGKEPPSFNGIELELTWQDLEVLELDVIAGTLPGTSGFFFGNDADEHYREQDLKFIRDARADLFCGLKVFYNSSW
jgi:hypothetical protein